MQPGQCPKCQYQRTARDKHVMEGICPSCGIAYAKFAPTQGPEPNTQNSANPEVFEFTPVESLFTKFCHTIFYIKEEEEDSTFFYGRLVLFILFFVWGWSFIVAGISWEKIGGSFLHNIHLPFHEFGHVLFIPFGRFMTVLGGSLFQIMLPFGIMLGFIFHNHDNFSASILLWVTGQSFIDLSPYIGDANFRSLPLIAGMGEEAHDWGNLLGSLGLVHLDAQFAKLSFNTGSIIMMVSMIWGGYILYLQKKQLR
jgi:hypothetical protein